MTASFVELMWHNAKFVRSRVMKSAYLSKIQTGELDPVQFVVFNLQNAVFLQRRATEVLQPAIFRSTTDAEIKTFITRTQKMELDHADEILKELHCVRTPEIQLNKSKTEYLVSLKHIS